jgi:AcrR family transcriptional regulator
VDEDEPRRSGAHRPSRRAAIVTAAIRVFARQGFADTSIQAVADEADVAPTAVYYHFSGKEELFEAALRRVMDSVDAVVLAARANDEPGDPAILGHVISAVWFWLEENSDAGRLLHHLLPGATERARVLQDEYERFHVTRAFDYMAPATPTRTKRSAVTRHATEALAARTLIGLLLLVHPMRVEDGPLTRFSGRAIRNALIGVSGEIVAVG